MKILKIFGIVVGIHVFALILIFANPGCSSSSTAKARPQDAVAAADSSPVVGVPNLNGLSYGSATESPLTTASLQDSPITAAPVSFNADASGGRYSPTRPGTPAATTLQPAPVADVIPASAYTVVRGDSLWSVAKKHQVTVNEIADANNISTSATLRLGQKLIIPGQSTAGAPTAAAPAVPPPAEPKAAAESVTHVVKSGETLGAIARKYQVSVGEIATANNITDPAKIRPGRELIIPGWKTPAAKPAATVAKPAETKPNTPIFNLPAPDQDLDTGLKKTNDAPVIKVEEPDPFKPL
jgi:LysM repeat protein